MDALVQLASLISSSQEGGQGEPFEPHSWTAHEDDTLRKAVEEHGGQWVRIAQQVGARTEEQCLERYQTLNTPLRERSLWTREEDDRLKRLVSKYGAKYWTRLAEYMPGRHAKQCRERWLNHLDPSVNHAEWTELENSILIKMQARIGNHWSRFREFLPGRPDNAIKNQWHTVLKPLLEGAGRHRRHPSAAQLDGSEPAPVGRTASIDARPQWGSSRPVQLQICSQQPPWRPDSPSGAALDTLPHLHRHTQAGFHDSVAPPEHSQRVKEQTAVPASVSAAASVRCQNWTPEPQSAATSLPAHQTAEVPPAEAASRHPAQIVLVPAAMTRQPAVSSAAAHHQLPHSHPGREEKRQDGMLVPAFVPYRPAAAPSEHQQPHISFPQSAAAGACAAASHEAAMLSAFPGRRVRTQPVPMPAPAKGPVYIGQLPTPSFAAGSANDWRIAAFSMDPALQAYSSLHGDEPGTARSSDRSPGSAQLAGPVEIPRAAKRLRSGVIKRSRSAPGSQMHGAPEHRSPARGLSVGAAAAQVQAHAPLPVVRESRHATSDEGSAQKIRAA